MKERDKSPETRLAEVEAELAFFLAFGQELTATLDDRKVLEIIAAGTHSYVGASHTTLFVTGKDRRTYEIAMARGYTFRETELSLSILEGICGEVLRTGRQVHLSAEELEAKGPLPPDLKMPGPLAEVLCIPILHRKRALATILLTQTEKAGPLSDEQMERLTRLLEQSRLAVDRALLYRKTADLAITDDLTQLFNHRYIQQSLEVMIKSGSTDPSPIALLFMDLDKFKAINDTHGHLAGSHALTEAANVLTDNLRTCDIIARYGGDEFVIILPDTDAKVAMTVSQRLCRAIDANTFLPHLGGMQLGASLGIAVYPDHATTPRKLVQRADMAMYKAKAEGGSQAILFDPDTM
ncbi:MAG: diguanylate cyclase [Leptospirillia bacterium]